MPLQLRGIYVPEDVVHLIFKEIILQGDRATFHTAALLSSTFLFVAQLHLYRSCQLNIGDPTSTKDVATLLDIIESRPYISTFVKHFSIIDVPHPAEKVPLPTYVVGEEKKGVSHLYQRHSHQNFIEIFTQNKNDFLPRLCRVLSSLSTLDFSFQCNQLDWNTLHTRVGKALEGLLGLGHLVTARLSGVINIPVAISCDIFNLSEVDLNNCNFALFSQPVSLSATDIGKRNHMRRLCMALGHGRANFEQVVCHWNRRQVIIPEVEEACLSINGWHGIWDAAFVLEMLGTRIKGLSLSTTQLELAFIRQQPPRSPFLYPSIYAVRLPHIDSHAIGDCFATDECDRLTTTLTPHSQYLSTDHGSSWFLHFMSPFRPRNYPRSFSMLRSLKFEVSHWRSAMETEANGELFWIISWLAELPLERAENIKELSIIVHVGTDFCLDNANALTELAGYQGWGLLDMIVAHSNWRSLEKVTITVRSRTTCLYKVEEKFKILLGWMKISMLPLLDARSLVHVTYLSLESISASQPRKTTNLEHYL